MFLPHTEPRNKNVALSSPLRLHSLRGDGLPDVKRSETGPLRGKIPCSHLRCLKGRGNSHCPSSSGSSVGLCDHAGCGRSRIHSHMWQGPAEVTLLLSLPDTNALGVRGSPSSSEPHVRPATPGVGGFTRPEIPLDVVSSLLSQLCPLLTWRNVVCLRLFS